MIEALYYEKRNINVQCQLCPHHCLIAPGKVGLCQVRRNENNTLFTLNYGRVSSVNLDPIEKKPLYHFYPGSSILSIGTLGCNLSCSFCQNWSISQLPRDHIDTYFAKTTDNAAPADIVHTAEKMKAKGNIGVAYTYNEPSVWFEFVLETARLVKSKGMKNILVTNGFIESEPLAQLLPYIDAVNLDIKSINDKFYKKLCGARLKPVLEYAKTVKGKCLLEVTNLLVTGENDSEEDIQKLIDFVAHELGKDTPLHFSRYHPDFQFDAPATPAEVLELAYNLASKKLDYVYVGNIWNNPWDRTLCPSCKKVVIDRAGFAIRSIRLKDGNKCEYCGAEVAVVC
ncbi:MAG: AmmeMemoRadiSam system radical SAM enzyme [Firmicutes bacterium]|nr:AmmeMemoRadiSam system radical SAM enzyme [Bacillota bacterium]